MKIKTQYCLYNLLIEWPKLASEESFYNSVVISRENFSLPRSRFSSPICGRKFAVSTSSQSLSKYLEGLIQIFESC